MKFVNDQSRIRNDQSFNFEQEPRQKPHQYMPPQLYVPPQRFVQQRNVPPQRLVVNKTDLEANRCPIHKTNHSLESCRAFQMKNPAEKRKVLCDNRLCFNCYSSKHSARECMKSRQNGKEDKKRPDSDNEKPPSTQPHAKMLPEVVDNKFTDISDNFKSCAKIVLVNVCFNQDFCNVTQWYAIVDEQSNRTLAKPELFDKLGIKGVEQEYCLNSCAGSTTKSGRRATDCNVMSVDGNVCYELQSVIECADIP